jgi:hypothetical protein
MRHLSERVQDKSIACSTHSNNFKRPQIWLAVVALANFLEEQLLSIHTTRTVREQKWHSFEDCRSMHKHAVNTYIHESDELVHASENDSASNYICHTIHPPAVRAVHLTCDVTLNS